MGKRSNFDRRPQDKYYTPYAPVLPLLPFLAPKTKFAEPCAGNGALVRHLERNGHISTFVSDIEPDEPWIEKLDAFTFNRQDARHFDMFITNPAWSRSILHPLIMHLSNLVPTWLLFDSDWMFTGQATPYLSRRRKIVSVGRVSWMENGTSGMDNCCWYQFDARFNGFPVFYDKGFAERFV